VLVAVSGTGLHTEEHAQAVAELCAVWAHLGELGDGFVVIVALDVPPSVMQQITSEAATPECTQSVT